MGGFLSIDQLTKTAVFRCLYNQHQKEQTKNNVREGSGSGDVGVVVALRTLVLELGFRVWDVWVQSSFSFGTGAHKTGISASSART